MIDIGGNNRAARRDFITDKFWRDESGNIRAEALPCRNAFFCALNHFFTAQIFALGDVNHFLGDDARFGELILRDHLLADAAKGFVLNREFPREETARCAAIIFGRNVAAFIFLNTAALENPSRARTGETFLNINRDVSIRIRPRGVIYRHIRLIRGRMQMHEAMRHAECRVSIRRGVNFGGGRERATRDDRGLEFRLVNGLVHDVLPFRTDVVF